MNPTRHLSHAPPVPLRPGLSSEEAQHRLAQHGPNEIRRESGRSAFRLAAAQFSSPLVLILFVACLLSGALGEWAEAIAITAILLLNAVIGFVQEYRAETAIQALMAMTAPRARVIRDGRQHVVPAKEVVLGDVLLLEAGDLVAADAQAIESSRFQVNEALLTGESLPVEKGVAADASGTVFMGTEVTSGTATAEVIATAMNTELGKIARLLATTETTTAPLQIQLVMVGKLLLAVCLSVVALVLAVGMFQGRPWLELVIFAISLAVAAVPEGMPAVVTVALALGVQRMAARHALIRSLPSVETLGSVTVICTDKTGTLTTGKMRVRKLWGNDHRALVQAAVSCCDAELDPEGCEGNGDPTELALLIEGRARDLEKARIEASNPRISTEPFDSNRKRMSVLRADGVLYVKGAPESILSLCPRLSGEQIASARSAIDEIASRGLRVLAIATGRGVVEKDLELLGLTGIADPPRTEVVQAIAEARAAGVRLIMITGDHPKTAQAIAREIGLVLEGEPSQGLVHARATPADKLKLIRQLKGQGAIVAMTGDGVNDAPALREAHIGIAMGRTGTEVTRQAADLILADDNFATIVAAIREGRGTYENIRKAVLYLLTGNFAELLVVMGASAFALPLPLMAAHLLWINLVTDALPGLALIADPVSSEAMSHPPRPKDERILGKAEWTQMLWIGSLEASVVLAVFWKLGRTADFEHARGIVFTTFVFSQIFRSLSARSPNRIFWSVGALSNLWLLGVIAITLVLQLSLHFIPLSQRVFGLAPIQGADLLWILPCSLITVTIVDLRKLIGRKWRTV